MSCSNAGRSVKDYATEQQLREALRRGVKCDRGQAVVSDSESDNFTVLDWFIPNAQQSVAQTVEAETRRLKVLQSYSLLDDNIQAACSQQLERVVRLGKRLFHVPICYVSVIDLGRAVLLAGLPSLKECPRQGSFCAHAVLSLEKLFVVTDASQDARFCDNPCVAGPMHIRFYAAQQLKSPEGEVLGVFVICDVKVRPDLTVEERVDLEQLSQLVMEEIQKSRDLHAQQRDDSSRQLLAGVAHDLLTPLTGIQLSLSSLEPAIASASDNMTHQQRESIQIAARCAADMTLICQQLRVHYGGSGSAVAVLQSPAAQHEAMDMDENTTTISPSQGGDVPRIVSSTKAAVNMKRLVERLYQCTDAVQKAVPLQIVLHPSAVAATSDASSLAVSVSAAVAVSWTTSTAELALFRAALNMVLCACARTTVGMVRLTIRLQPSSAVAAVAVAAALQQPQQQQQQDYTDNSNGGCWVLECDDSGPPMVVDDSQEPQTAARLLFSEPAADDSASPRQSEEDDTTRETPDNGSTTTKGKKTNAASLFKKACAQVQALGGKWQVVSLLDHCEDEDYQGDSKRFKTDLNAETGIDENDVAMETKTPPGPPGRPTTRFIFTIPLASTTTPNSKQHRRRRRTDSLMQEEEIDDDASNAIILDQTNPSQQSRRTALVIDDSLVVRKVLCRALTQQLGFRTATHAVNGLDGFERMKLQRYDLVLCDFLMPIMDGMDCVRAIRAWEQHQQQQHDSGSSCYQGQFICGMSAHATGPDVEQMVRLGLNAYRPKPITLRDLQDLVALVDANNAQNRSMPMDSSKMTTPEAVAGADSSSPCTTPNEDDAVPTRINRKIGANDDDDDSDEFNNDRTIRDSKVCLVAIAEDASTNSSSCTTAIRQLLANKGWDVVVAGSGEQAFRLLQNRNWGMVLVDGDDLPGISGVNCVMDFRQWEQQNRVHRQRHVYLMSSGFETPLSKQDNDGGSGTTDIYSLVHLPSGIDGMIGKPANEKDIEEIIENAEKTCNSFFQATDIVMR